MTRLEIQKGDTIQIEFTFTDFNGVVIDLTDCELYFTVKRKASHAESLAVISKKVTLFTAPETGVATVVLASTETLIEPGLYFYDVQLIKSDETISSSQKGVFYVNEDITDRIS